MGSQSCYRVACFFALSTLFWVPITPGQELAGTYAGELEAPDQPKPLRFELILDPRPDGVLRGSLALAHDHSPILGQHEDHGRRIAFEADFDDDDVLKATLTWKDEGWQGEAHLGSLRAPMRAKPLHDSPEFFHHTGITLPEGPPERLELNRLMGTPAQKLRRSIVERGIEGRALGLSVGIAIAGHPAYVLSLGWEDIVAQTPASAETMYRWASVAKPLTAVVALQLASEGRLELERDVRDYVPEFPDKGVEITASQLLCHQGGIVHYGNGPVIVTERSYELAHPFADIIHCLDRFKDSPLVARPGEAFSYTSHGYILLGAVIQRSAGVPFVDVVTERVLEPLKMTSTQPDYPWVDIPNRAQGYRSSRLGLATLDRDEDVHWKLPAGGWISTILDLTRFAGALAQGDLLSERWMKEMEAPRRLSDGRESTYGYGISSITLDEHRCLVHSGRQSKAASYMIVCPDESYAVCVLSNTANFSPSTVARECMRILLNEEIQVDESAPAASLEDAISRIQRIEADGDYHRLLELIAPEDRELVVFGWWFGAAYEALGASAHRVKEYEDLVERHGLDPQWLEHQSGRSVDRRSYARKALLGKPLRGLFQDLVKYTHSFRPEEPVLGFEGTVGPTIENDGGATVKVGDKTQSFSKIAGSWYWDVLDT